MGWEYTFSRPGAESPFRGPMLRCERSSRQLIHTFSVLPCSMSLPTTPTGFNRGQFCQPQCGWTKDLLDQQLRHDLPGLVCVVKVTSHQSVEQAQCITSSPPLCMICKVPFISSRMPHDDPVRWTRNSDSMNFGLFSNWFDMGKAKIDRFGAGADELVPMWRWHQVSSLKSVPKKTALIG